MGEVCIESPPPILWGRANMPGRVLCSWAGMLSILINLLLFFKAYAEYLPGHKKYTEESSCVIVAARMKKAVFVKPVIVYLEGTELLWVSMLPYETQRNA